MLINHERLRAYGFGEVGRPPELWPVDCDSGAFWNLVSEMVRASGVPPRALMLNLSNMVVPADAADERMPAGEYVAVSVVCDDGWGRDGTWSRRDPVPEGVPEAVCEAALAVGAEAAYSRALNGSSSITVLLPRADSDG
jgi:hypothetical protein